MERDNPIPNELPDNLLGVIIQECVARKNRAPEPQPYDDDDDDDDL